MSIEGTTTDSRHCWHAEGHGSSTCMTGLNSGMQQCKCCRCGIMAARRWTEKYQPIRGHGPHARAVVRVYESDADQCPGVVEPLYRGGEGTTHEHHP